MPKFPTYHGELPECLNPLNPRHYWLLLYWVFFRPTALKCYLYQADPQFYQAKFETSFLRIWTITAYRNLITIALGVSLFLSASIALPETFGCGKILDLPVDSLKFVLSLLCGVGLSSIFAVITGMLFGFIGSVATSVEVGVVVLINGSIAIGTLVSLVASLVVMPLTKKILMFYTTWGPGLAAGIVIGGIVGIVVGAAFRTFFKIAGCVAIGFGAGLLVGFISGVTASVITGMATNIVFQIGANTAAMGGLIGVVIFMVGGITIGVVIEIIGGLIGSIAFGGATSIIIGALGGAVLEIGGEVARGRRFINIGIIVFMLAFAIPTGIGALRLMFYPFQWVLALLSAFFRFKHPAEWDELSIIGLPATRRLLKNRLQQNERQGLRLLTELARNPFRRPRIQASLYAYLHQHANALGFVYQLFTNRDFDEYVVAPVRRQDWAQSIACRRLFLGNLALRFVKTTSVASIIFYDKLIWWVSYPFRKRQTTPLTDFAGMLYDLQDKKIHEIDNSELLKYAQVYNHLSAYPGGDEIAQTFDALATFLSYRTLANLPDATAIASHLRFDDPIRPAVITALQRLGAVGAEINVSQDSTSRANQMAALARATDMLKELGKYVLAEVVTPEQVILQQIIRQWQDLLISAGGELGRAEVVGPVANPFVVGNPVKGSLFVGREDVLRRLEELWRGEGQKPSIVLYGHRRMGKSSILHNLGARFGQEAVIIDFNMQRAGMVSSTGELLYNLALSIYDGLEASLRSASDSKGLDLPEPDEERFLAHNPSIAFDRFLKQVDQARQGKRLIVAIDEFELIERKIEEGKLDPQLLDFCRGLIQSYAWFVMVFAGLHTLQEMARNYWNPLFGSVTGIMVSFLNDKAAQKLITQPTADFALDYDQEVIAEIIRLTHGQPYLIQLICHSLVSRFNQQTFEDGVERERRFTLADLHAVIHSPEFFRDGDAYFTGIWQQEQSEGAETQHRILQTLAQSEIGVHTPNLADQSKLPLEQVQPALAALARHDVVADAEHGWQFNVELMRRWVLQKEHVFS